MKKGLRKTRPRIGLDIGTRLVKIVEVSQEGDRLKLAKFHLGEIKFPLTEDQIRNTLKSILENFKPSVNEVNISFSAPSAIVRFISMPKMKEEELKNSIKFEAEKYIPFKINEVVTDAIILENTQGDSPQMRVLLAAAKKNALDSRLAMLKDVGLSASVIDIDSFACFNAFCNAFDNLDKSKSTVLINIGYTQTNVLISRGNNPFFTRDIQIGGKDIARAVSKELETGEEKADSLLFNPQDDKKSLVFEAAKSVLNTLVDELRLSFGYYENQYGKSINEIYISGGVTRLDGILGYLEEHFGIKPLPWNPFAKFEIPPEIDIKSLEAAQPQFAVCAGLAIRK